MGKHMAAHLHSNGY
jgi:3-hydroxyisobutyrate dehydrogenase